MVGLQYVPVELLEEAAAYADFFAGRTTIYPTLYEERMRSYGINVDECDDMFMPEDEEPATFDQAWLIVSDDDEDDVEVVPIFCPSTTIDMLSSSDCSSPRETGISGFFDSLNVTKRSTTKPPKVVKTIKKRKAGKAAGKKTVKRSVQRAL
ncbi:hypothetical protein ACHHYP_07881 [Achlya hypogyna]|uniref:Uncharacterized protein n=1 Tax=Achlya hypogyna TaxID=1202772 RepID=A0A1V9ZLF1_ACHHY|nr:hypothetical protein ACHHYP_07881 [Achlya hypogyna]